MPHTNKTFDSRSVFRHKKKNPPKQVPSYRMAEKQRFEPWIEFSPYTGFPSIIKPFLRVSTYVP